MHHNFRKQEKANKAPKRSCIVEFSCQDNGQILRGMCSTVETASISTMRAPDSRLGGPIWIPNTTGRSKAETKRALQA